MMYGREKSDSAVAAKKPTNKVGKPAAEWVEPRGRGEREPESPVPGAEPGKRVAGTGSCMAVGETA